MTGKARLLFGTQLGAGWFMALLAVVTLASAPASAQVTVTATAGTPGPTPYTTLKGAFDAINLGTHQASITVAIGGNTTETATAELLASGTGASSYTDVLVQPTAPAIVTGTITGAVIKLTGADNVTIDGRIAGSGRNLTVSNGSALTATAAIWLTSTGVGAGATGNIIRNLEIACGATQNTATVSTFGIIMASNNTAISVTSGGDDNDSNSFIANRIVRARYGIVTRGQTVNNNQNIVVTGNIVGPAAFGADQIGKAGILMQADNLSTVSGNTVQFVGGDFANTTSGADRIGIAIGNESWSSTPGTITSSNYTVTKNIVHDIVEERTFSAVGINLANTNAATGTSSLVANNFVFNVRANGTAGDAGIGIGIAGGGNDRVVYNSISMTGDIDPGATVSATQNNAGIRVANANGVSHFGLELEDNSIYVDVSSNTATLLHYDIVVNSAAYVFGAGGMNFNNYFFPVANAQMRTGGLGTTSLATTPFVTLANWQGALTAAQDASSVQADPLYVSNTADLHCGAGSGNSDVGTPIAGVTDDIDAGTPPYRSATTPDIGADEIGVVPVELLSFVVE